MAIEWMAPPKRYSPSCVRDDYHMKFVLCSIGARSISARGMGRDAVPILRAALPLVNFPLAQTIPSATQATQAPTSLTEYRGTALNPIMGRSWVRSLKRRPGVESEHAESLMFNKSYSFIK